MNTQRPLPATAQNLLENFPSDKILEYTRDELRCIDGHAPKLKDCVSQVGEDKTAQWVETMVVCLLEYYPLKEKMTVFQLHTLGRLIVQTFPFLKLTDIMLFVRLFWLGHFGKVYTIISPQDITDALHDYVRRERNRIISENYE